MTKVLFVCYGNICRSPMAEFMFKDIVKKNGTESDFYIESAATSDEEVWNGVGNTVHHSAQAEMRKHGISGFENKRARQITRADYDKFDLIIGMEKMNVNDMLRAFGGDPDNKVKRLLDYSDRPRDISDPWFTHKFDITYSDLEEGLNALYKKVMD